MMSREFFRNGNGINKVDAVISSQLKSIKANNSIGDIIIEPSKREKDAKTSYYGVAGISGGLGAFALGLMEQGVKVKRAIHEVRIWEQTVNGKSIDIPVSEGVVGGELMIQAIEPKNEGYFGNNTSKNAIELERELRKQKGKLRKIKISTSTDEAKAVVIVHSNDFTVQEKENVIIRVDPRRVGRELNSLAYSAAIHGVQVNADTLKKDVYGQTKTLIKLNAKGLPIFDVGFEGDKAIVKAKGVVHSPR